MMPIHASARTVAMFVAAATVSLLSGPSTAKPTTHVPIPNYWPTAGWEESTPERQGIDSAALLRMFEYVHQRRTRVHNVLIVRNGYVVLDASFFPYQGDTVHDLASVTKAVTSTLVGAALQDGTIGSVDAPVHSFFPPEQNPSADPRKAKTTIADLLTMRSGLACETPQSERILHEMMRSEDWVSFARNLPMKDEPGKRFEYCSSDYHLLSAVLANVTGMSEADYARVKLFAPLGIHDAVWPADPRGVTHGWGDLHLFPRDAAKIGFLWLHSGMWERRRLLAERWVHEATSALTKTTSRDAGYGYGFWVFTGRRAGEYEALGRGGQRITVLPQLNAVAVLTGGGFDPDEIGAILNAAVKSDGALPENPAALEKLRQATTAALVAPPAGLMSALTPMAKAISDRTYSLGANDLDLTDFTLRFPGSDTATLEMTIGSARHESHPVSLSQRPALSPGEFGLPVALNGRWAGETFVLDYDEIANNHAYRLRMRFSGNTVDIQASDLSGGTMPAMHGHAK